jgi:large subunit ribosomal protein L20
VVKYLNKKRKIVVGKVIVAKAIGIFILYIGEIRFVSRSSKRRKSKRIAKRKKNFVIRKSFIYSMTRTKRGYIARRRRTKTRFFVSSFRGAHSSLTRTITQQERRALLSSHRDRDRQKRDFRRLWITRLNAVIREIVVYYSYCYNKLIHDLYKRQLLLNRKILAQMGISNRKSFYMISNEIIT